MWIRAGLTCFIYLDKTHRAFICLFLCENVQLTADYENHHMEMVYKALLAIYKALD